MLLVADSTGGKFDVRLPAVGVDQTLSFLPTYLSIPTDARVGAGLYVGATNVDPSDDDIVADGGIYLGRNADPGTGNVAFTGSLISYKNSTEYTGYAFVPLIAPLTSTSWDGDSFSTTAKTLIDLSAVFGVPAGVKAVLASIQIRDSASSGGAYWLALSPNNTTGQGPLIEACENVDDRWTFDSGVIPCDANGDIYYQIAASGTNTMDVYLQVWWYFI